MNTASVMQDDLMAGIDDTSTGDHSSVSKALLLLTWMGSCRSTEISVSELATRVGLPKSTTHRLLKVLEAHGFVGRTGVKYRIGERMFEISEATQWSAHGRLRVAALPVLETLFDRVAATIHLGVLREGEVVYVEKISGKGGCRIPTHVGARMPATCTALGKSLLAFGEDAEVNRLSKGNLPRRTPYSVSSHAVLTAQLSAVRRDGVAFDREESRFGVVCVAAPVVVEGRAVAAISASGFINRFSPEAAASNVMKAAQELSRFMRAEALDEVGTNDGRGH